ncbi:MAG: hypothetical protein EOM66_02010 [Clostridia bacterium]|nr:DUF6440 family protein [Candidatus Pelethousia sp.]NCB30165.1 hypothetical protein [Clostridia bacterium]
MGKEDNRFIRVHHENGWSGTNEIWVDRQTGVNYLYHSGGYSGGLCVCIDADGKPIITRLDEYGRIL